MRAPASVSGLGGSQWWERRVQMRIGTDPNVIVPRMTRGPLPVDVRRGIVQFAL